MNDREKEIIKKQLKDEKEVLAELKKQYEEALKKVEEKLRYLEQREDVENLQTIIYQMQYQQAIKEQITSQLDMLKEGNFTSISEFLEQSYENGFIGVMYDLQGQGIPLIIPIDQKQVVKALLNDTKLSKNLYKSIVENVEILKKEINQEISRGISSSMSYHDIARNISNRAKISLNKAYRIARTEGHRINQAAADDARYKAKERGCDIVKQWDSSLDNKTRPSHRKVDGEIIELDETFSNGLKYAGDPNGKASEVINCRCVILQRAKWALDENELLTLKERAAFFELDKAEQFNDFKEKYMKAVQDGN